MCGVPIPLGGVWLCVSCVRLRPVLWDGWCVRVCVCAPPSYHVGRVVRKAWEMSLDIKLQIHYIMFHFAVHHIRLVQNKLRLITIHHDPLQLTLQRPFRSVPFHSITSHYLTVHYITLHCIILH